MAEPLGLEAWIGLDQILQMLGLPHPSWVNLGKYFNLPEPCKWCLQGMLLWEVTKPIQGKRSTQCPAHRKRSVRVSFYYLAPTVMLYLDLRKSTTRRLSFKWAHEASGDRVYIPPRKQQLKKVLHWISYQEYFINPKIVIMTAFLPFILPHSLQTWKNSYISRFEELFVNRFCFTVETMSS